MADEVLPIVEKELTDKERRFVDEYCVDCHCTKAAIRAGYSPKSARQIGSENLSKPYIRAAIDKKLKEMSLTATETTKLIVDIAKASINPYIRVSTRERAPMIRVGLQVAINQLKEDLAFEDEFAKAAGLTDKALEAHQSTQASGRLRLLRMEMTLQKNPKATTLIEGEPIIEEYADLDLVALSQDKEAGRIKSLKHTEYGIQVELYPADAALRDVARMHGLFAKDNEQSQPLVNVNVTKEEAKEIAAALNADV